VKNGTRLLSSQMADSKNSQISSPPLTPNSMMFELSEYEVSRSSKWSWLGRLLFRLLLLGVGGGIAAAIGVVLALANPQPTAEKPLVIRAWQKVQAVSQKYWPESLTPSAETITVPATNLSEAEKQQLRVQLDGLATELNSLRDRARELEARAGITPSDRALDERFQTLEQVLNASDSETPSETSSSLLPPVAVKVTLRSDVLFNQSNTLTDEAKAILDATVEELRRYPGSTIRIGVHTDASANPEGDRERSFRSGRLLEEYLKAALGDRYRFVTVGYGQSQPLAANDTPENRSLNRRVEIVAE
jgi:outer membrane protein OmpA-like peptidoglycan-associated protein